MSSDYQSEDYDKARNETGAEEREITSRRVRFELPVGGQRKRSAEPVAGGFIGENECSFHEAMVNRLFTIPPSPYDG